MSGYACGFKWEEKSKKILEKLDFSNEEIVIILDAIKDHSFSQNKIPKNTP